MPAKSFGKVHKQISKKRGGKPNSLHQNSRDAQRLQRASKRDDKLDKRQAEKLMHLATFLQRINHFQIALNSPDVVFNEAEIFELVHSYVLQYDQELTELASARRPGRPPNSRETNLKQKKEDLQREFRSGFWCPDMRDDDTIRKLRDWEDDWSGLGQMKFIRVDDKGNIKEGSFPPNKG